MTERERESWVSREWEGWMDARSQGFIPEPIGLQTLAQQDVETQTHTTQYTCVCVCVCVSTQLSMCSPRGFLLIKKE